MKEEMAMRGEKRDLSFSKLTAMIIGSTIGSGIFTTTADMTASGAHTGSILIGWAICGTGMLGLTMSFFGLNKVKPELTNGVFSYAKEGFGEFIGFNSAWGYWISALLCNVSYMTLLFGAIGYFFPVFGQGNNLVSILCASVIIWILNLLVLGGIKEAAALNVITTISKLVPILVFIVAVIFVGAFKPSVFMENFWGAGAMPLGDQIKATTSATVWSFIGIEGAVVLSGRAIRSNDVGKASMTGFLGIFAIYVMVAVLQLGVMPAEEMAQLSSPQMAGILELAVGPWGAALINIAVILSLAGALLGWTIIAADCPYSAARQGVFMRAFARSNQHGSPSFSLYLTNGIIQLFLIVIYFNESTYQVFYTISTSMIMVPYLLSSLYYLKIAVQKDGFQRMGSGEVAKARVFGFIGTVYGIWMLYSSGLNLLFITSILYAPGLIIYVMGKKEKNEKIFERSYEPAVAVGLIVLAVIALGMIATGKLNPF
ncbi:basic amino acid/polyamine antiporter [Ihubacter sp. rT4E-8]|uniref:basic amino acid/polyamine antiporter n=1 Tax=unclassified Ihubacter TaxID=2633299 RepID=UPI003C7CCB62